MPYYYFEAVTATGEVRKKVFKARDRTEADRRLRDSGLRPILIESARVAKKRQKAKQYETRKVIRNALSLAASVSVVAGIATYLVMLDLSVSEQPDIKALSHSGIVTLSPGVINAETSEEREFARQITTFLNQRFPDFVSGITIKHRSLMMIYVKYDRRAYGSDDEWRLLTKAITTTFQKRFGTTHCTVYVVEKDTQKTLTEGRFRSGEVTTEIY